MKRLILTVLTGLFFHISFAQKTEDSVKAAINRLFAAMKNGDAAGVKSCFSNNAVLQTIVVDSTGATSVRTEDLNEFADFVGKQKQGAADERITFSTMDIDGPLATVWTPYQFFYNGTFRHCGADSFEMVRINGEWKIQYLIDTRRKTGCANEPVKSK